MSRTPPEPRLPERAARRAAGFTLLELMVVMGLIGMLLGMGIGFLQRSGTDHELALSMVRDQLRIAALTARTRHLPTEVELSASTKDAPATARARVLAPVGQWHMEETERWAGGPDATFGGTVEPGRFGMARRAYPDAKVALLSVPTEGRASFDLRDGFALRLDVRIEAREPMVLARLGGGLILDLDSDLVPAVKLVGTEGGAEPGPSTELHGKAPLRLLRWHTLEVVHDRRTLTLLVDGRAADSAQAKLPLWQTRNDVLWISPPDAPATGLIDEVQLLAYEFSDLAELPVGIELEAKPPLLEFDRLGALERPCSFVLSQGEDRREFRVGPGGLIE